MDLNARVDVNFEFSNGHCELILLHIFFFILISINIKVLLIHQTEFQQNMLSNIGEMYLNACVDVIF